MRRAVRSLFLVPWSFVIHTLSQLRSIQLLSQPERREAIRRLDGAGIAHAPL